MSTINTNKLVLHGWCRIIIENLLPSSLKFKQLAVGEAQCMRQIPSSNYARTRSATFNVARLMHSTCPQYNYATSPLDSIQHHLFRISLALLRDSSRFQRFSSQQLWKTVYYHASHSNNNGMLRSNHSITFCADYPASGVKYLRHDSRR